MPPPGDDDLRWSLPLAGGAMMDLGCYALHVVSTVADAVGGIEPVFPSGRHTSTEPISH
jgi:hypothetical protein